MAPVRRVFLMDLLLASSHGGFRLKPQSALGMVWLQTHFDDAVWSHLATGRVQVSPSSADRLVRMPCPQGSKSTASPTFPFLSAIPPERLNPNHWRLHEKS